MNDTNFYILKHKLYCSPKERDEQLEILGRTIKALEAYRCKPGLNPEKVATIQRLIVSYESIK